MANPDDASITKTIITLGHALNLKVIAEGVETMDHQEFLTDEGCDEVQGFRYSKPIPEVEFMEFINNYSGDLKDFWSVIIYRESWKSCRDALIVYSWNL